MEARREGGEEKVGMARSRRNFWRREWTFSDMRSAFYLLTTHLVCIFAPFYFTWKAFWLSFILYIIVGLFGMTLSYHRNLSHNSFKLPKWLEYLFAYMGVMALQGDPIEWVSIHRYHHQFVETERDPHSPHIQGFWYSHIGWTMDSYALSKRVSPRHAEDIQHRDTNILHLTFKDGRPNNVGDLEKQFFYRFIRKTYLLHLLAFGAVLYLVGGFPFLVWSLGVASTFGTHVYHLLNSACHIWGKQPWNTHDSSKNNWWVALISFGEGWHNNHHAFEYSAKHGLEWWQLDVTWYVILCLQAIGLATHVKFPSQNHKLAKPLSTPHIVY